MGLYDIAAKIWKGLCNTSFAKKQMKEGGVLYGLMGFSRDFTCKRYSKLSPEKYPEALKAWFKRATGHELNLDNPKTFSEKIQWAKLYDSTEEKGLLSDKYAVRDWVEEKIGKEHLIPIIGAYDSFDEIDFDSLPDRFVMKCNHASGWNLIVKDKDSFDKKAAKKKFDKWMSLDFSFYSAFQLHYHYIKRKIVVEEYFENIDSLDDYKFLCFDGVPHYVWKDTGRFTKHCRNVYDMNWNRLDLDFEYPRSEIEDEKPAVYDQMLQIVSVLCKGFSQVRVDLYEVDGKIYFGEMTFTSGNGLDKFKPYSFDEEFGKAYILPEKKPIPDLRKS